MAVIEVQRKLLSMTLMADDNVRKPDAPHARVLPRQNADLQTLFPKSRSQHIRECAVVDDKIPSGYRAPEHAEVLEEHLRNPLLQ
jgi:hypothetical protein